MLVTINLRADTPPEKIRSVFHRPCHHPLGRLIMRPYFLLEPTIASVIPHFIKTRSQHRFFQLIHGFPGFDDLLILDHLVR